MKFTELETQDDIDRYQIAQEDAILEAGLKVLALFTLAALVMALTAIVINYAGF